MPKMKLSKDYIAHPHIVEGIRKTERENGISESSLIFRLFPKFPSITLNFQKIEIESKILGEKRSLTPYEQFVRESAPILNTLRSTDRLLMQETIKLTIKKV